MSLSWQRVKSLNVLRNWPILPKDSVYNLRREFSLLSVSLPVSCLPNVGCHQIPTRSFYKHKVEVDKRIQWTRPVKVPSIRPVKSGDLSGLPEVNFDKPPSLYEESKEYQTASDYVKRVVSLKFQKTSERKQALFDAMIQRVKRHKLDTKSVECKIAKWTAIIRNMQVHNANFPYDRSSRADLQELIDLRKKRMKLLRSLDYKKFEWLLEQLDLLYKPPPTTHERVERKKSMRWLADEYCENVVKKKLDEYKEQLNSQKRGFLERKLSTMKSIVEEEKSLGVEPSFTTEEIIEVEEILKKIIKEEDEKAGSLSVEKEVY
ncbi:28S ribosomal protein S15, mitochondrial [Frankliniella fusca]|uniref:Small ribosomal subunit protein uS15m n=1 Tax=Frankliniella fusca TaxID=407009 RepID=A0AAE1H4W3_9NEOP|nr:28S ribosomal protein S15, mitochondrial [Frankliniella fusca]